MARETITVACARPNGLILRVTEFQDVAEPSRSDAERTVKRSLEIGRIKLNGYWDMYPANMRRDAKAVPMAHGLTFGVDKELFSKWMEQNKHTALVKDQVVFAHAQKESVDDRAKEINGEFRHKGSDPLDPTMLPKEGRLVPKDPRYPRPMSPGITSVTAAER